MDTQALIDEYRKLKANTSKEEWEDIKLRMFNEFIGIPNDATCQTCKYWEMGWKHFEDRPLSPLVTNNDYGRCVMVDYAGMLNEVLGNPATIYFSIGDDIQLITSATFGCNQHEPKEVETAKENH